MTKEKDSAQKTIFMNNEGDAWYRRNMLDGFDSAQTEKRDPVINTLQALRLPANDVLEVGTGNGWRIAALKKFYPEARLCGVDPSTEAIKNAVLGGVKI